MTEVASRSRRVLNVSRFDDRTELLDQYGRVYLTLRHELKDLNADGIDEILKIREEASLKSFDMGEKNRARAIRELLELDDLWWDHENQNRTEPKHAK
ncbi:MAG: hypothetical protein AAFY24_02080 [Pseudomonadota bacterium]